MVPPVVTSWRWIIILPAPIVDWNSHFLGVSVVHTIGAAIVIIAPIVLGVGYVRVMVKSLQVSSRILLAPDRTKGTLLCICRVRARNRHKCNCANCSNQKATNHWSLSSSQWVKLMWLDLPRRCHAVHEHGTHLRHGANLLFTALRLSDSD